MFSRLPYFIPSFSKPYRRKQIFSAFNFCTVICFNLELIVKKEVLSPIRKTQDKKVLYFLCAKYFTTNSTSMAPKVKSASGVRKPLENGSSNGEAVVSSTSESLNGDIDAATVPKASSSGRKAKKEISIDKYENLEQKHSEKNATSGRGRGRKKAITTEIVEEAINEEDVLETKKKSTTKSRGKKVAANAIEDESTQISQASVLKNEKSSARKARKATPVDEALEEITNDAVEALATSPKSAKSTRTSGKRGKKVSAADIISEATVEKKAGKGRLTKQNGPAAVTDEAMVEDEFEASKGVPAKKRAVKRPAQIENDEVELKEVALENTGTKGAKKNTKKMQAASVENVETKPAKAEKTTTKRKAAKEIPVPAPAEIVPIVEIEANNSTKKKTKKNEENTEKTLKVANKSTKQTKAQENNITENLENGGAEEEKKLRGRKRALAVDDNINDDIDGAKPSKAKKPGAAAPLNSTSTKYNKADFVLEPTVKHNLKISSWNVAGLRSWLKKDGLRFLDFEEPDIFCLQEIKCTIDQLPDEVARIPGYHPYWLCMPGGYAGVAIYSKIMPINVLYGIGNAEFDDAGRMITAEYEKFYLINVYVPNSGRKLVNLEPRMRWEKLFQAYVQRLDALKPVIICGDMNVSHQEIDLANPKTNTRNAGFTQEERDKMSELLSLGYVDTFRHLYPKRTGAYSFWTYMGNARSRNVGWRLDYFIVSERFTKRVVENCMRTQVMGSDHCPITLFVNM